MKLKADGILARHSHLRRLERAVQLPHLVCDAHRQPQLRLSAAPSLNRARGLLPVQQLAEDHRSRRGPWPTRPLR